jgi:hypothetical protein
MIYLERSANGVYWNLADYDLAILDLSFYFDTPCELQQYFLHNNVFRTTRYYYRKIDIIHRILSVVSLYDEY